MPNQLNKTLQTNRLILRLPEMHDAQTIQQLAGDFDIARTTLTMPHPYEDGMAEAWIQSIVDDNSTHADFRYAIERQSDAQVVGVIGFEVNQHHHKVELGYWVGKPYWGNGYATEACQCIVDFCFAELRVNRVEASYYTTNVASRRVMEKAGMTYEGTQRQAILREIPARNHRVYHDLGYCGILRSEWQSQKD